MNIEEMKNYYNNSDSNYSINILESYIEIDKYNQNINEKIYGFITKAKELEEVSDDDYELQKSLETNKIFFRGYILESNVPMMLEEVNQTNYTMDQLKDFMKNYENQNQSENFYPYYLAFDLYDMIDEIEELVDRKIDYEMDLFNNINISVDKLFDINKDEYESYYNEIKRRLSSELLNNNLIDDKIHSLCIQILNDIFNYYISGYPDIPDEFLYIENDNN